MSHVSSLSLLDSFTVDSRMATSNALFVMNDLMMCVKDIM